jgi:hypothetical protein
MLEIDGYKAKFDVNFSEFSAKKLCEIIITARYLGSMNLEAISCMQELARRRAAGDVFDYETFIETEGKKLPDFKINMKQKMQVGGMDIAAIRGIK